MWTQLAYLAHLAIYITMSWYSCYHGDSHPNLANISLSFVHLLFATSLHSSFYHLHICSFMFYCFITTNDSDLLSTFTYMLSPLFLLISLLIYQSWQLVSILLILLMDYTLYYMNLEVYDNWYIYWRCSIVVSLLLKST